MVGIDWNRYAQMCEESAGPAIDRFEESLRKSAGMATNQSIPVYMGLMKGSLVTVLRQMTDILEQLAQKQLSKTERKKMHWKELEARMREAYFERLAAIDNMMIAEEYLNTRVRNKPSDYAGVYRWVSSLRNNDKEIRRIASRVREETSAFAKENAPDVLELEMIRMRAERLVP